MLGFQLLAYLETVSLGTFLCFFFFVKEEREYVDFYLL